MAKEITNLLEIHKKLFNVLNNLKRYHGDDDNIYYRDTSEEETFDFDYDDVYWYDGNGTITNINFQEFESNAAVKLMHKMPRLSHVINIINATSLDEDEIMKQYYYGVISMSVFIFLIFFVWTISLLVFKLQGRSRLGCVSGSIYAYPTVEIQREWYKNRLLNIRIAFLISGGFIIVTTALIVYSGLIPLHTNYLDIMDTTKSLETDLSNTELRMNAFLNEATLLSNKFESAYDNIITMKESCASLASAFDEASSSNNDNILSNESNILEENRFLLRNNGRRPFIDDGSSSSLLLDHKLQHKEKRIGPVITAKINAIKQIATSNNIPSKIDSLSQHMTDSYRKLNTIPPEYEEQPLENWIDKTKNIASDSIPDESTLLPSSSYTVTLWPTITDSISDITLENVTTYNESNILPPGDTNDATVLEVLIQGTEDFIQFYKKVSKSTSFLKKESKDLSTSFESYHEVFLEINNTTSNIDSIMDTGSIWYTYSLVFLGIVGLLTLIFVCRVLFLPSTNKDDDDSDSDSSDDEDDGSYYSNDSISKNKKTFPWICVQSYILIPIYFISFFLLLFSTCGFAIFVVINADICTTNGSYDESDGNGGPDTNIMAIAEYKLMENNESAYNVLEYYIKACTSNDVDFYYSNKNEQDPFQDITDISVSVTSKKVDELVIAFDEISLSFNEEISIHLCPDDNDNATNVFDSYSVLKKTITELDTISKNTNNEATSLLKSISCNIYTPIYIHYVHEDICNDTSNAIIVIFFCALVMTLFVMILLTLRVSLLDVPSKYDIEYDNAVHDDDNEAMSSLIENSVTDNNDN